MGNKSWKHKKVNTRSLGNVEEHMAASAWDHWTREPLNERAS